MIEFLRQLFSSDFMGHGYCYLWKPEIIWLHAVSDGLIALAYYVIPVTLVYFVRKRRDLPFHWMFFMFGMFIFGCGTTHAMEIWTLWYGTYRLAGIIKALTASASVATAVALVPLIPRALLLPSPRQLRAANLELEKEIAERRRTETALRESEERFRNMADTAPVMIWVAGPDKLCTFFNKCCLDFTGHSLQQKIGDGWIGGVHPEDRERFLGIYSPSFDAHQGFQTVFRLRRADGEYRWMLTTGSPRWTSDGVFEGFIGSCVDITELKRTQEEALSRQKLESLGVLAGGIAHDFNNLLGGILAEAELAESDIAADLSPYEELERIKSVAIRGSEIVRELMIYAGQDQGSRVEPVDLSQLVEEMLGLVKVSISKQAVLKINLGENLPPVLGNGPQIRQVVMNLVINASEAIGDKVGVVHVSTSHATGGPGSVAGGASSPPTNDYVRLEVSDTGCGMTDEAKAKIFDPFFTTKFAGRGLGLAVVQRVVRDHGGILKLVSAPDQGATFQVLLPCTSKTALQVQNTINSYVSEQISARKGTILVVEDEEVLRLAVSKGLRQRGFSVLEASDGSAAMNLVRTQKDEIDVILLDVTLPGTSSKDILDAVHRTATNVKVVLMSAYSKQHVDSTLAGMLITNFIRKPFQLDELAGVLRDAQSA